MRIVLWASAIVGLLFSLADLLAKGGSGFAVPGWVAAAALVCYGVFAVVLLIAAWPPTQRP